MDKLVYVDDNYPIGIYLDKNHKYDKRRNKNTNKNLWKKLQ